MIGVVALLLVPGLPAVAAVRQRRSWPVLFLAVTGWAAASVVAMLWLLLQVALVSEGSLPPDDLAGSLPSGVHVADRSDSCGSGGCTRAYVLRGDPAATATGLATRVEHAVDTGCRRRLWVPDLRQHCQDVDVIDGRVVVHSYLQGF